MFESEKRGGHQGRGGFSGAYGPDDLFRSKSGDNGAHLVFVGSLNCLRHKPYMGIGRMMQQGSASILCPTLSDFSSGKYLSQIEDAVCELAEKKNIRDFVIVCGCQWVILSTDGDLIVERLKEKGLNVTINVDDHLEFGDHA